MMGEKRKFGEPKRLDLDSNKQNTCIILSNRFEKIGNSLSGYKRDEENITKTFKWLNFEVKKKTELTQTELLKAIREYSREDYEKQDCFVLFVLSHGNDKREIQTIDTSFVKIETIVNQFSGCKTLEGVPKLFFIQACRGCAPMGSIEVAEGDVSAASKNTVTKAEKSDILVYYSTCQENVSWVGPDGSFFIKNLCKVLQEYGGKYHLGDVVTKVNDILSTYTKKNKGENHTLVQVSEACHTLTRNIYFHPKLEFEEFMKGFVYKDCDEQ